MVFLYKNPGIQNEYPDFVLAEKEGFELLKSPTIFNHKLTDVSISAVFSDIIYYGLTIFNYTLPP